MKSIRSMKPVITAPPVETKGKKTEWGKEDLNNFAVRGPDREEPPTDTEKVQVLGLSIPLGV